MLEFVRIGPGYAGQHDPNTAARQAEATKQTVLSYGLLIGGVFLLLVLSVALFAKRK